jgi:hypothetical protein
MLNLEENKRFFNNFNSPTHARDFIWFANYFDDTYLTEFSHSTLGENNFYSIDKNKLAQFGLMGHGYYFNFHVANGSFNISKKIIDFAYESNGNLYRLTNNNYTIFNDIITYKNVVSDFSPSIYGQGKNLIGNIEEYNFGYKTRLEFDGGLIMNFTAICSIPVTVNSPIYFTLKLSSNKDIDGKFLIIDNGKLIKEEQANLKTKTAGQMQWIVR